MYLLLCLPLSPAHSLSGWHIPLLQRRSFVISLCERRGIRSCMTELLSVISGVQMDDPSTLAWPTDKKPSHFVRPFPFLSSPRQSISESAAAVICYTIEKKRKLSLSPKIPYRAASCSLFGPPKGISGLVVPSHLQCFHCCVVSPCS